MPAMSMPFEVSGITPGLREGDRIAATLVVDDEPQLARGREGHRGGQRRSERDRRWRAGPSPG